MGKEKKVGRPKKEFDIKQVEIFGRFKATYETMADYFGVSEQTIRRNMQDEDSEFSKVYKKNYSFSKLKLSEAQFKVALEKLNPKMLIWMGKQHLGQREPENNAKININIDIPESIDDLSPVEINELYNKLKEKRD